MAKVSVVLISYNVEKYISNCLNSIVNQTLQDIEIICVDDGSKDLTLNIIEAFANEDKRIRIIAQANQGPFSARMNGLQAVTGEYVVFIDGDDWIDCRELEITYQIIEKNKFEVVFFDYIKEFAETKEKKRFPLSLPAGRVIGRDELRSIVCKECMGNTRYSSMCTKMYHVKYLKGLSFPRRSDLHYGEDLLFLLEVYDNLDKTFYIDEAFYHYYVHSSNSLSNRHTDFSVHKQLFGIRMKYAVKWDVEEYAYANFIYYAMCEIIYEIRRKSISGVLKYIRDDELKWVLKKENKVVTKTVLKTKRLIMLYEAIKLVSKIL